MNGKQTYVCVCAYVTLAWVHSNSTWESSAEVKLCIQICNSCALLFLVPAKVTEGQLW